MNNRIAGYGIVTICICSALYLAVRTENLPPLTADDVAIDQPAGLLSWACPSGTVGRVGCFFVTVPEDYDDPEIRTLRLFTARIDPPIQSELPPFAFLGADLGSVAVSDFGEWQSVARRLGRTVVLVDLRGTGASEPRLGCAEVQVSGWPEADLNEAALQASIDLVRSAVGDCHERVSGNVTLDAWDLDAMARDVDTVRERIGIDRWVVAAGGDATFVARRLAAVNSDSVTGLVLIGAAPSLDTLVSDRVRYAREVLAAGLGDEAEAAIDAADDTLSDRSLIFPVQTGGRTRRVAVNDSVVAPVISRQLGDPEFLTIADNYVNERLLNDQWRSVAVLRDRQQRQFATMSLPVRLNVVCAHGAIDEEHWWRDPDHESWLALLDDHTLDPGICRSWEPRESVAVELDGVPTLLVNGELDARAPRSAADEFEGSALTSVVLAGVGAPDIEGDCVIDGIKNFLDGGSPRLEDCS